MIFDSLKNKQHYQHIPLLYEALCFLDTISREELPPDGVVLIKNRLFCTPVSLTTRQECQGTFEAHRKYTDLHYIISGVERIATADIRTLSVTSVYDPENDVEFLEGIADSYCDIKPGQFMVCFPSDAHKPAIMQDQPADVRKIVFKIQAES